MQAMNRLFLLRHARARWAGPGMRDYDRPLEPSGHDDALRLGAAMAQAGYRPETVLCSGARRARETWAAVAGCLPEADICFIDGLYSGDAGLYLEILRGAGAESSVMIVGHNPMMEDLATALARSGDDAALATVARGFPTCGLAVLRFSAPLTAIKPEDGYLEAFLEGGR